MPNRHPQHILNTSSNLLGFCLVVLTSLKISKYSSVTSIDEMTGIACILLIACSLFSFLSLRSTNVKMASGFEELADKIFIAALIFMFGITFMVAFSIIF